MAGNNCIFGSEIQSKRQWDFWVQLKYSGSLPAFIACQKDSGSTGENGTQVKPVLLAVKRFAVWFVRILLAFSLWSPSILFQHLLIVFLIADSFNSALLVLGSRGTVEENKQDQGVVDVQIDIPNFMEILESKINDDTLDSYLTASSDSKMTIEEYTENFKSIFDKAAGCVVCNSIGENLSINLVKV